MYTHTQTDTHTHVYTDYEEFKTSHFIYLYNLSSTQYICNINITLVLRKLFYTKYLHYFLIIEKRYAIKIFIR